MPGPLAFSRDESCMFRTDTRARFPAGLGTEGFEWEAGRPSRGAPARLAGDRGAPLLGLPSGLLGTRGFGPSSAVRGWRPW